MELPFRSDQQISGQHQANPRGVLLIKNRKGDDLLGTALVAGAIRAFICVHLRPLYHHPAWLMIL
jgi:mRNA-degrading endonuclease toxin of MazEF toxin-antitoxin module